MTLPESAKVPTKQGRPWTVGSSSRVLDGSVVVDTPDPRRREEHRAEPPVREDGVYVAVCSCGFEATHPFADGAAALLWCHLADVVLAER